MLRSFALVAGIVALSLPAQAFASNDCEGSEWFCEDEGEAADSDAPSETRAEETRGRIIIVEREGESDGADEEVDEDKRVVVVIPEEPTKRKRRHRRELRREFGLNLRLETALMGEHHGKHDDARMAGLGGSFRYRAVPHFAFDLGLDFLGGRDWNGFRRTESIFSVSGLIFLNPQHKFQVYMLGGMDFSAAEVDVEPVGEQEFEPFRDDYSYFGGHFGGGIEYRLGLKTAINLDLIGFLRGRTDARDGSRPEYIDPDTGLATNTSGGGLVRAGITFYW